MQYHFKPATWNINPSDTSYDQQLRINKNLLFNGDYFNVTDLPVFNIKQSQGIFKNNIHEPGRIIIPTERINKSNAEGLDGMIKKTPPLKLQVYYKFTATSNYTNFTATLKEVDSYEDKGMSYVFDTENLHQLFKNDNVDVNSIVYFHAIPENLNSDVTKDDIIVSNFMLKVYSEIIKDALIKK